MRPVKKGIFLIILAFSCLNLVYCTRNVLVDNPERQIEKLVEAIQQRDFKTAFELSPSYMLEIVNIKANNPKVLWEKKISGFYEATISALNDTRKIETVLDFAQYDMTPISSYKLILYFFPPSSKWQIIETRGRTYYISVEYPKIDTSPILKSIPLKKTMFQFEMSEDGLFRGCSYMKDGEEGWENSLLLKYMEAEEIKQHITMKNMYKLGSFIYAYIEKNGIIPKYEGIFNESSDIYIKLSMAGRNLSLKDEWGNYFFIEARMIAVGSVGFQEGNTPDFIIISYGRDGVPDEGESPTSLDFNYICKHFTDFNKDIRWRNKGFTKMPKLLDGENLILYLQEGASSIDMHEETNLEYQYIDEEKQKQKTTMRDISQIGTAIADYIIDHGFAPAYSGELAENSSICSELSPFYLKTIPISDAWGTPYYLEVGKAHDKKDFLIISFGRDKVRENSPAPEMYRCSNLSDFDRDIIVKNGVWFRAPIL